MNFLLTNIEVALEEEYLLVGEKLWDEKKVGELFESERNLWLTQVDGFEVEMQISPSRVKAVSCECDIYLNKKLCGHIVAGLFALRKLFSEKRNPVIKKSKAKPKVYRKLTTAAILENIKTEELKAFVTKYAKQNRSFALALGTRFASSVPLADNHGKYQLILSQLIQGVRKKDNQISANGFKQFLKTANELSNQAQDAFALKNYTEAWAIISSIIPVLPLFIRSANNELEDLKILAEDLFKQIDQLTAHPISPELKTEIWSYMLHEAPKKSYRTDDLAVRFIQRFIPLADDDEKKQSLFEVLLDNWKYRNLLSEMHKSAILNCLFNLFSHPVFQNKLNDFENDVLDNFQDFRLAISAAQNSGQKELTKELTAAGKNIFKATVYQDELEKIEFQMAILNENKKEISALGEAIFFRTKDLLFFQEMKNNMGKVWPKKRSQIIKKIIADNRLKDSGLLPIIYAEESLTEELQDHLLNVNSLELTMKYDYVFVPKKNNELAILYRSLLDDYFSQHYGSKPSKYLLKILNHLRSIGADEVAEKIVAFIRKKYPRRMELAIELMSIQP